MKNYLIIGASSGIGKSLTIKLLKEGNKVFATYNKNSNIDEISGVAYHHLDVTDDAMDFAYLPDKLDGLAYCAGSIQLRPFKRLKPENFVKDFDLQVVGAIKSIQAVLPKLMAADSASIVLFSTVAVQMGFNFHSQISTSKGALEGLSKALAAEFAPKIRVNCIAPSLTDTAMAESLLNSESKREANAERHPLKRIGKAEDHAAMASFLLSEDSGWITGQILHVDGGMSTLRV